MRTFVSGVGPVIVQDRYTDEQRQTCVFLGRSGAPNVLMAVRIVFVDHEGNRHIGENEFVMGPRAVDSDSFLGLICSRLNDCPPGDVRAVAFEQRDTPELRARVAAREAARKKREAEFAEAAKDCPFPSPTVGKPYAFTVTDMQGNRFSTEQHRGKVIVLDFWATWCGPCVAEHPKLRELYERYHDRGLEIVGISFDADHPALDRYLRKHALPWPQVRFPDDLTRAAVKWVTGVGGIPRYFVIDPQGNLHTDKGRGRLEELVEELMTSAPGSS